MLFYIMNYLYVVDYLQPIFGDYMRSIKNIINYELIPYNNNLIIDFKSENNYIFMQTIPQFILDILNKSQKNIYVINTEQLSRKTSRNIFINYPNFINIIDYYQENLKYLDNFPNKFFLPYQVNFNEIYNIDKTKDVCQVCFFDGKRLEVVKKLEESNIIVTNIKGWEYARDKELFTHKILINIGAHNDYRMMETFRCDRCVYNKMIIVSEIKEGLKDYYLKNYIIFVEYSLIADVVKDILNNYETYYSAIFEDFDIDKINQKIRALSETTRKILTS